MLPFSCIQLYIACFHRLLFILPALYAVTLCVKVGLTLLDILTLADFKLCERKPSLIAVLVGLIVVEQLLNFSLYDLINCLRKKFCENVIASFTTSPGCAFWQIHLRQRRS